MEQIEQDVVIVGGGIGGSGLAAVLARAGARVTVLERTTAFPDRVRGEMWTPWGVAITSGLGLLDPLLDAGARFTTRWTFYDAMIPPEVAEELGLDVSTIVPGVPGILNITHPVASSALLHHAIACGATVRRGVLDAEVDLDRARPTVRWRDEDGETGTIVADLVAGADGRASRVRRAAGIELHSAPVRQYISGLLIEADRPLSAEIDSYGSGTDVNWYSFPQGPACSRVYLAHFDVHRYSGTEGTARFLADLRQCASPDVAALADGRPLQRARHPSLGRHLDRRAGCTRRRARR